MLVEGRIRKNEEIIECKKYGFEKFLVENIRNGEVELGNLGKVWKNIGQIHINLTKNVRK